MIAEDVSPSKLYDAYKVLVRNKASGKGETTRH